MNKCGTDPKVKKSLVRNFEQKVKPARKQVVHDVTMASSSNNGISPKNAQVEKELSQPTLCSSEALANYLSDVKKSLPPSEENVRVDKGQFSSKITKKLNFHFNDRIYKNLIELNANVEETKSRKSGRRPSSGLSHSKRDLEPNIEDFFEDEKEIDSPPNIPVMKPKYKPVKYIENGDLHKLVASFEDL
ncbi:uncharacterized protein LOC106134521 [Amyelois transitella]|uniref:uncharacterized protein LOC106134521 n=1 Tax=Amyelois transitella TaxID=680683 RepID=UPI00067C2B60|nr:uncharacterized protein LOC106134521 [Amyelois transitella]